MYHLRVLGGRWDRTDGWGDTEVGRYLFARHRYNLGVPRKEGRSKECSCPYSCITLQ